MTTTESMYKGMVLISACNEASRAGAALATAHHHHLGTWPKRDQPRNWIDARREMLKTLMNYIHMIVNSSDIRVQNLIEQAFDGALFGTTLRGRLAQLEILRDEGDQVSLADWPAPQKAEIEQDRLRERMMIHLLHRRN